MAGASRMRSAAGRAWSLVAVTWALGSSGATAQLYSTDPYDPWGRGYRGSAYPGAGGGVYLPGIAAGGRVAPNQMDRLLEDELGSAGGGLRGDRYDSSFRRYDRDFGREYVPNQRADAKYLQDRDRRERQAIGAMMERDPKKRAELERAARADAAGRAPESSVSRRRDRADASIPPAPSLRNGGGVRRGGSSGRSGIAVNGGAGAAPALGGAGSSARRGDEAIPPAPSLGRGRRESPADNRPSDVLERARRSERELPLSNSPRRSAAPAAGR